MSAPFDKVVVVTGGLGTGKSSACRILRELGAFVVSADELAREVVAPGSEALSQITAMFGAEMLLPDGSLDRKKMGTLVFNDPSARKRLEAITHPAIQTLAQRRFELAIQSGETNIIYDCPLFFEAGLSRYGYHSVILISCAREISIQRVMERDGLGRGEAEARYDSQFPIEEKEKRADLVIQNQGTLLELRQNLLNALKNSGPITP